MTFADLIFFPIPRLCSEPLLMHSGNVRTDYEKAYIRLMFKFVRHQLN